MVRFLVGSGDDGGVAVSSQEGSGFDSRKQV